MMDERIEVSTARIVSCIEALGRDEFTTADVIRQYSGTILQQPRNSRGLFIQRAVR